MTKDDIISIANDKLINKSVNLTQCINLVKDYVEETHPDKLSQVMSIFQSLPQPIQINLIDVCINYFIKKYEIKSIQKVLNTPFGNEYLDLLYFI